LVGSGIISEDDKYATNEYLQILTQTGQRQVELLGKVDTGVNEKMMLRLGQMNENFKNPAVLKTLMESTISSWQQTGTPQTEALKYSILSQMYPGKSLLDYERMRENPTIEMEKAEMQFIKNLSPNEDMQIRNVANMKNLTKTLATDYVRSFNAGKMTDADYKKAIAEVDLKSSAYEATGSIRRSSAGVDNTFALMGDELAEAMKPTIDAFNTAMKGLLNQINDERTIGDKIMGAMGKMFDSMGTFSDELVKKAKAMEAAREAKSPWR
jgi:hypothetical protein